MQHFVEKYEKQYKDGKGGAGTSSKVNVRKSDTSADSGNESDVNSTPIRTKVSRLMEKMKNHTRAVY